MKIIFFAIFFILIFSLSALFAIFINRKEVTQQKVYPVLDSAIYIVQVETEGVTREDYQGKLNSAKSFYTATNQSMPDEKTLEKNVLDGMVNDLLVTQYAKEQKLTVSDAEVLQKYDGYVNGYNKRNKLKNKEDDAAFLAEIKRLYGIDKSEYLAQIKMDILKERVQYTVQTSLVTWLEQQRNTKYIKMY